MTERIAVETLQPGDTVELPVLGAHVVSSVTVTDGVVRVIYFRGVEVSWTRSRWTEDSRLVERGLRPMRVGELVEGERGKPEAAEELRTKMLRDQERRHAEIAERYAPANKDLYPEPAL